MQKLQSTLVALAVSSSLSLFGLPAAASDHIDSPILAQDHATDINDTWAFLDPNDNSKVVLMMSTNPFLISSEIIGQAIFDPAVRYRFEIENTGDATPDRFVDVRYSPGLGRLQPQTATITLPGGRSFTAPVTISTENDVPPAPVVTTDSASGVSFFAGATDDPFFLDNTAANRFVLSSILNPGRPDRTVFARRAGADGVGRDTYAGFNALLTVVSVPVAMLRGTPKVIGINSVTQRQRALSQPAVPSTNFSDIAEFFRRLSGGVIQDSFVTIDRDGTPLVNNGLIPAPRKDEYNAAPTADDARGRFRADIIKSLQNLGTTPNFINQILTAAVTNGDILRLDLTVPNTGTGGGNNPTGGFGHSGGRRLQDDVVDGVFTLINNGTPLGDFVNANDAPFRNVFPFVAAPIQPNPLGVDNPDDRTRL